MQKLALSFCLFAASALAGDITGFISDSNCKAANAKATKEAAECARTCVKGGAQPVFVTEADQKVYKISDPAKVASLVGEKVVVTGNVKGDTVEIASVKAAK